jgi:TRAP-type C4-dicarboxylate transport system permease small subunit
MQKGRELSPALFAECACIGCREKHRSPPGAKMIRRLWDYFLNGLVFVGAGLYLFMMVSIAMSVFLRRTDYALAWKLEVSEYILLVSTFFGAGWLLKKGEHVRVDILSNLMKGKYEGIYNGFVYSIVAIVCLVLTYVGVATSLDAYWAGTLQVKVYAFPKWIILSLIPFGCFILFVEAAKIAYKHFSGKMD